MQPAHNALQHNKNCDPMLGLIQISICDAIIDDDKDELRERKEKARGSSFNRLIQLV